MNEDLFYEMEMKLIPVLVDMEWEGIKGGHRFSQRPLQSATPVN